MPKRYLPKGIKLIEDIIEYARTNPDIAKKMMHEALHVDTSTGILSRRGLETFLEEASSSKESGILYIDLMGLKKLNDTHGHQAGDKAILDVATSLRKIIRKKTKERPSDALFLNHEVGRMGGDEFVVVLKNVGGYDGLIKVARRIQKFFNLYSIAPIAIGGAIYRKGEENIEQVVNDADKAMYDIKDQLYEKEGGKRSDYAIHFGNGRVKVHPK